MAPKITNQQQFVYTVKDYTRIYHTRADLQRQARELGKQLKEMEPEILSFMRQEEIPGVEVGQVTIRLGQAKTRPGITEKMIRECDYFQSNPDRLESFLSSLPREPVVKDKMNVKVKRQSPARQQQQQQHLQLED